jgi:hypothetical protein
MSSISIPKWRDIKPGSTHLDEGDKATVKQCEEEERHEGAQGGPQAALLLQVCVVIAVLILAVWGKGLGGDWSWGGTSAR